jgi:probable rRNA maturation factor
MTSIHVYNRQRRVQIPILWLQQAAKTGLDLCLEHSRDGRYALRDLSEIEVSVVSDRTIAKVHRDFLQVPGATDVITFEHGELVISADTAEANAAEQGTGLREELLLYIIHGMLHLNGFTDEQAAESRRMQRVQEKLLKLCLRVHPPE